MTRNKKARDLARKLYLEGESTDLIAQRCKTSRRTIQRWIKDFEKEPATITIKSEPITTESFQQTNNANTTSNDVETSVNDVEILPTLEKAANLQNSNKLDLTITSRMAVNLLKLTEKSLSVLDDCLSDSDVRKADKLKAIQLIGEWSGLKDGSVLQRLMHTFNQDDLNENLDVDTSSASFVPKPIADAKRQEQRKREQREQEARRIQKIEHLERIQIYSQEIYRDFCKNQQLPENLNQDLFDFHEFLDSLDPNEKTDYEHYEILRNKALQSLWKRGYQEELILAGFKLKFPLSICTKQTFKL